MCRARTLNFLDSSFASFDYICLFTTAHLLWKLPDWGHKHNHHGLYAHFHMSSEITLDAQNTKDIYWATSDRAERLQNLLDYFRIYWTTSEFTGLLQNLLDDFRIYWTTSEFTGRLQNLLDDFKIYWTTSEFTGRLQNLLGDFRIYWITSDFYCEEIMPY